MGQRFVETLRCVLEPREKVLKGEELSRMLAELENLEIAKADAQRRFADQIKLKKREVDLLANDLRLGTEERPVECYEYPRFADNMVDVIREDTGTVVRSRPMRPDERQQAFMGSGFTPEPDEPEDNAEAEEAH